MKKIMILCLSLLCFVLLSACGNDEAENRTASEPANPESAVSEPVSSETVSSVSGISEPISSEPETSEESIIADRIPSKDFSYHPYLEVNETTQLPETLPIYEDEFPMFQSRAQYPFEKLSEEDAKASMGEYLRLLGGITGQPVPEIETYMEESSPLPNDYRFDDVNDQILQMQYRGYQLAVRGLTEKNPDFFEATAAMDEERILADPLIQAAVSYREIENPDIKILWGDSYNETHNNKYFRIAEKTDDFQTNLLSECFSSISVISGPGGFRISINLPLPENSLEEAAVVPYETAKEFIETQTARPVVYCEAVYDRNNIYPGRYIPVYRFFLQGDGYVSIYLVPMTDYYIPQGEEMQQYMDESFGEYAGTYYDPKYTKGSYHVLY